MARRHASARSHRVWARETSYTFDRAASVAALATELSELEDLCAELEALYREHCPGETLDDDEAFLTSVNAQTRSNDMSLPDIVEPLCFGLRTPRPGRSRRHHPGRRPELTRNNAWRRRRRPRRGLQGTDPKLRRSTHLRPTCHACARIADQSESRSAGSVRWLAASLASVVLLHRRYLLDPEHLPRAAPRCPRRRLRRPRDGPSSR